MKTRQTPHRCNHIAGRNRGPAAPAMAGPTCGERTDIVRKLSHDFKEAPQSVGMVNNQAVIEVFVSGKGQLDHHRQRHGRQELRAFGRQMLADRCLGRLAGRVMVLTRRVAQRLTDGARGLACPLEHSRPGRCGGGRGRPLSGRQKGSPRPTQRGEQPPAAKPGVAPGSGTRSGGCASAAAQPAARRKGCRQPARSPRRAPCRPRGRLRHIAGDHAPPAWPALPGGRPGQGHRCTNWAAERARTGSTPRRASSTRSQSLGVAAARSPCRRAAAPRAGLPRRAAGSPRAPACGRARRARSARLRWRRCPAPVPA